MSVVNNPTGTLRYVDLPLVAGTNPAVSYTTPRSLDLMAIEIFAAGATSAAVTVDGANVAAGALPSFTNKFAKVWAQKPTSGVPLADGTAGATQGNQTVNKDGFYANWQSSGTVQSGIKDRTGSTPVSGNQTPLSAAIPANKVVQVTVTGAVTTAETLPAANGNGVISLPTGTAQGNGLQNLPTDSIPYQVKATDTLRDTFAGVVRLVFQVPKVAPAAVAATPYPAQPVNGIVPVGTGATTAGTGYYPPAS